MGVIYLAAAVGLGGMFTWQARRLARSHAPEGAMKLFKFSITYITYITMLFAGDGARSAAAAPMPRQNALTATHCLVTL